VVVEPVMTYIETYAKVRDTVRAADLLAALLHGLNNSGA
jgi:hypothetical protein